MAISNISFFSRHLELYKNNFKIGDGTGFICSHPGRECLYLVSNFHVLTGRLPSNPAELLPGYPDSPDEIRFTLNHRDDFESKTIQIKIDGDSHFILHPRHAEGIDIAAMEITFSDEQRKFITTQSDLNLVEDIGLSVTSELSIVGYPWGQSPISTFPIWKTGHIASEPDLIVNNLHRFYIDAFTHPGMSGSPVFATEIRQGMQITKQASEAFRRGDSGELDPLEVISEMGTNPFVGSLNTKHFRFVGIYSGRLDLKRGDPSLGIVWRKKLIDDMIQFRLMVKHPYPPIVIDSP